MSLERCFGLLHHEHEQTWKHIGLECIYLFWILMCCFCLSSSDIHGLSIHLQKSYLSLLSSSHFHEWAAHVADILTKHEIFQMKPQANCSHYVNASHILPYKNFLLWSLLHGLFANVFFLYLPFKSYSECIILKPSNFLNNNEQLLENNVSAFKRMWRKIVSLPYKRKIM